MSETETDRPVTVNQYWTRSPKNDRERLFRVKIVAYDKPDPDALLILCNKGTEHVMYVYDMETDPTWKLNKSAICLNPKKTVK